MAARDYPIRSGPSSTRRPWHIPTRTRAINSAALHHERCTDRGVSAVPSDTWPMCALSRSQLCLHDQVDLDTLTAELLAGCDHQTVEPTASCSGCGRRSPPPGRAALARKREPVWSRSACFLIPSAAGCLTRLTDHRDRRQGGVNQAPCRAHGTAATTTHGQGSEPGARRPPGTPAPRQGQAHASGAGPHPGHSPSSGADRPHSAAGGCGSAAP